MKYTKEHEWLDLDGDIVTVGITEYAAEQLGDIVFIELPEVGDIVKKGDDIVVIESVKAASDITAPLDGEIIEINEDAEAAWFFKIRAEDPSEVDEHMDEDAYQEFIE